MLEHDRLQIEPWNVYKRSLLQAGRGVPVPLPLWVILETNARTLVGLARPAARTGGFWARWFGRARLAVYESDDEPLLCTLCRCFRLSSNWELRDADGHIVGRIARTSLQGPMGRYVIPVSLANATGTEFLDLQGRRLATLIRQGDGCLLSFAVECKRDPFVRMLVLGAALVMKDS